MAAAQYINASEIRDQTEIDSCQCWDMYDLITDKKYVEGIAKQKQIYIVATRCI